MEIANEKSTRKKKRRQRENNAIKQLLKNELTLELTTESSDEEMEEDEEEEDFTEYSSSHRQYRFWESMKDRNSTARIKLNGQTFTLTPGSSPSKSKTRKTKKNLKLLLILTESSWKVPRDDYIIINYRRDCGPRAFQLQLNIPGHKDKWYAATLRDLPTRVETHKTWDNGETLFKVADVAQVLIVEAISKEYLYPNDFPQYDDVTLDDGISPHTKNITNTRYRWAKEAKIPPLIAKTKSKETTSSSSSSSSKVWESDSDEEEVDSRKT